MKIIVGNVVTVYKSTQVDLMLEYIRYLIETCKEFRVEHD